MVDEFATVKNAVVNRAVQGSRSALGIPQSRRQRISGLTVGKVLPRLHAGHAAVLQSRPPAEHAALYARLHSFKA
jgi:hypothetical protein